MVPGIAISRRVSFSAARLVRRALKGQRFRRNFTENGCDDTIFEETPT
jgi:hypothetical protein